MAGDWIKVEHSLSDKPEVHQMAQRLNISPEAVVGHLVRAWAYADQQGKNVDGSEDVYVDVGASTLEAVARLPGFVDVLVSVGWLRVTAARCTFPGLQGFISESAKLRALRNRRQRRWRDGKTTPREEVRKSKTPGAKNGAGKSSPHVKGNGAISDASVQTLGRKIGLEARPGESMEQYRGRVLAENEKRREQ